MSNDLEKKEEMSKEELVYVMTTMLNCIGFEQQFNKLSKPCLFRLFDDMSARGNAFSNIEENVRSLEQKNYKLHAELEASIKKEKLMFKKLQTEVKKTNQQRKKGSGTGGY
jgi:hypothetical protein